eukprot:PhF_6_TR8493/c0_g1_i1/m.13287
MTASSSSINPKNPMNMIPNCKKRKKKMKRNAEMNSEFFLLFFFFHTFKISYLLNRIKGDEKRDLGFLGSCFSLCGVFLFMWCFIDRVSENTVGTFFSKFFFVCFS